MKLIGKVQTNKTDLRRWCEEKISILTPDVSNYAKGRLRLWLFAEVDLRSGAVREGYYDERIWNFAQRVYPGCDIGLLTFNGGIKYHRDHNYATPNTRGINLGSAIFGIKDPNEVLYQLKDGDIYEFNCKKEHAVLSHSPDRFSLTFWKMRDKYADQIRF
jgi:hypothetical protein